MRNLKFFALLLTVWFFISGCVSSSPSGPVQVTGETLYNKYNLHIQYKSSTNISAHYANWTGLFSGHRIIPPNTPVEILPWNRGFIILMTDTGEKIKFHYSDRHMGMDKQAYIDTIFSSEKVSLDGLSSLDKKGVKQGRAIKGMTRKGVMTAMGYPAAHKTLELSAREWIFWTNRFGTIAVMFGSDEKVTGVRD